MKTGYTTDKIHTAEDCDLSFMEGQESVIGVLNRYGKEPVARLVRDILARENEPNDEGVVDDGSFVPPTESDLQSWTLDETPLVTLNRSNTQPQ
jgi:hypothetical protein